MNAEDYIKEQKQYYKTAKQWAKKQIKSHKEALENGDIDKLDKDFINLLKDCTNWHEAYIIAKDFII